MVNKSIKTGFIVILLLFVIIACTKAPIGKAGSIFTGYNATANVTPVNRTIANTASCIDTDGGLNYYVKGTTSWILRNVNMSQQDRCVNNMTLAENYCSGNTMRVQSYRCPNGCSNGACIAITNTTTLFADLMPTSIDYAGKVTDYIGNITDIGNITEGKSVVFTGKIINKGPIDSGVFNIKWFVDAIQVGYGSLASIKANATGTSALTWNAVAGVHNITFVADADNHVKESNENNNQISIGTVVAKKPVNATV